MRFGPPLFLIALCLQSFLAQAAPRAVLADGDGPWRDSRWVFAATEFTRLLSDAGYTITTVSPVDLPSALGAPDILLAVPSLESLPFETFQAVTTHLGTGGSLMATGGEPFRNPLYRAPGDKWLDAEAYSKTLGSPPPQGPFRPPTVETLSPSYKQYTTSSGVRVPFTRGRGLSSLPDPQGRCRVIGDLLAPAATLYLNTDLFTNAVPGALIVWLPWAQLSDPLRGQLVAALHSARNGLYLLNAGPQQIVNLPGESITGSATIINSGGSPVQAGLQWSISGPTGIISRPTIPISLAAPDRHPVPLDFGNLPNGSYVMTARLMIGNEELDRIDSPVRVLDPTVTRQPDQKIRVINGAFYTAGRRVFLQGVNYWPRYVAGLEEVRVNGVNWFQPYNYDPDLIEADLSLIASLHLNLVNIQYGDLQYVLAEARSLIDFLERCRNHGIWVNVAIPASILNSAYAGLLNPNLGTFLHDAYLPGNDRVFAYNLLWEPFAGSHDQGGQGGFVNGKLTYNLGRQLLDPDWRAWINEQYGSLANAEQIWGLAAPRDAVGRVTNPLDSQISNDGPWRILTAAYRRFSDDYFGRNLGLMAREIRRTDPDTPLSYRNWTTMTPEHNFNTGYDIGTAAAHLDFFSPERYQPQLPWPEARSYGLVTAYSRYRTAGKPVHWAEFGSNVGPNSGTPDSRAGQAAVCDTMMRQIEDDGSNAASVWWWPGGYAPEAGAGGRGDDYGIIDPDGAPRDCALALEKWAGTFTATPPDMGSGAPVRLTVDRDADARGEFGIFLNWQTKYVEARQAGQPVVLVDQGTGTDTSTMPLVQVGNAPYTGTGPLKFANAEFGGIRAVCPNLDITVENGSAVPIPAGTVCQVTATLVNTGEAQWLPASASKGGVILHTNMGDAPLTASTPSLQRIAVGPLTVRMGQDAASLTGRLKIQGVGDFGESLNVMLTLDSTTAGPCATTLNSATSIIAPPGGAAGSVIIATAAGCAWTASSPQSWVTVTPVSGTGNGAVNYSIEPNIGPARQTTILVAGHPFTVRQTAIANPELVQAPTLSATTLHFASQTVGVASAAQAVTLTNTGTSALKIAAVAIGGANSTDFVQSSNCGLSVAAGGSCIIRIAFTPSVAGTRAAALFITGNISGGALAVTLSGTGASTGPAPVIQAIVDAWGYSDGVAPGLWVTIGGTNLAGPPQTWNLNGVQQLPTTLGGVTVTFNGTAAALLYVSTTQINALVPASAAPGPVRVVVELNGVNSAPFTIMATPTQPAAYAPPNADGSTFFVTAALQGTAFLVGNHDTDPRVMRAVYPGDIIDVYMIGLGATTDPSKFITDRLFSGAFPVSAKVTATVGGKSALVLFAGLTAPGLYLARISIPSDLAVGPQPLQVSTGGAQTRSSLVLMVEAAPPNLIPNGSWNLNVDAGLGAAATLRSTSAHTQITVVSAAANTANGAAVQLRQVVPIEQSEVYRLQFSAKADTPRTMRFDVSRNGGDLQNYGLNGGIALSGDWQQHVIYFQATATDAAALLNFYFGDRTGNAWIDAVVLQGTRR